MSPSGSMPWCRSRRTAAASPSSSVVTAPPSPVVTILRGWKERQPIAPEPPARHPLPARAERPGRVLEQVDLRRDGLLQRRPVERSPEEVHGQHRLRSRRHGLVRVLEVEVERRRVDVDEHGRRAREPRRRSPSPGTCTRARSPRRRARCRARARRGGAPQSRSRRPPRAHAACCRHELLELRDLRPHRQRPRLEDAAHLLELLVAERAGRLGGCGHLLAIPRDRPREALVEIDLRLEAEHLARLLDVRDPQLDVGVVERLEDDLARRRPSAGDRAARGRRSSRSPAGCRC